MKLRQSAAVALFAATLPWLSACEGGGMGGQSALESQDQKASYGVGRNVAQSLLPARDRLDLDALMMGLRSALDGEESAVPEDSLQVILQGFAQEIQQAQREEQARLAEANDAEGQEFLAENEQREGVQTTESGLQYEIIEEGDGQTPSADDQVRVHYTGTLLDGTEFDSSQGGEPAVFQVGGVIPGFAEGLQLMPVGSTYRFWIPGQLAYGPQGAGPQIGPNQTLVFEVELLGIE